MKEDDEDLGEKTVLMFKFSELGILFWVSLRMVNFNNVLSKANRP